MTTIIGINTGYFLGYDGRYEKYLRHPLRSIIGDTAVEHERMDRLAAAIDSHDPDIIGLVEIDQGSIRTRTDGQAQELAARITEDYRTTSARKYRDHTAINVLPVLGSMANGALYRDGTVQIHRLERGWKRLLLEIRYDGLSVFICHLPLSLFRRTQARQLREIADILQERDRFVLYGDFNIGNHDGLAPLTAEFDISVHRAGPTYPVHQPEHAYDMILAGPGVTVYSCRRIEEEISDHLGIMAEVTH